MEMKKYLDIERLKDKYADGFKIGEHIVITEKLDGANASIRLGEDGKLEAYSRRTKLDESNTLRGFYNFVQDFSEEFIEKFKKYCGNNYIIFGEWLIPHTVKYPTDKYNNFYVFDIYDTKNEIYLPWKDTRNIAQILYLKTVPEFYNSVFKGWEDIYKLVGKTEMGAEPCGEGIVIKSQDRLNEASDGRHPSYVKIVSEKFSEVHNSKPQKAIDTDKLAEKQAMEELAGTIVTQRRVEKLIQKFIEDGLIPEDWDEKDLKVIAKNLPNACYHDCVKEEPEVIDKINEKDNFGRLCAKISMAHAKNLNTVKKFKLPPIISDKPETKWLEEYVPINGKKDIY